MNIRIFSGIRPSGKLHLGNYLGAIKNWLELQDQADLAIFAVVDLHGITTPYDPAAYQAQVHDVILDYLAAGLDPDKSLLIRQSHVPQHAELAWLFNTITPVGWLERLPNYREKVEQVEGIGGERAKSYHNNLSLLAYPVLMAADILLYKSTLIPVGEDQFVHINVTNEIGHKFNAMFDETFPNVKAHIVTGARIMSLQDPSKKMSKTGDEGIALSDDPDTVRAKLKKAVTDSGKEIQFDEKSKPAVSNLLTIYHLLSGKEIPALESEYIGKGYVQFKSDLAEIIVEFLKPLQAKRTKLEKDTIYVKKILETSEAKAREIAETTMREVREKMGLR